MRELMKDIVESLPARERDCIEALFWERISQHELARRWGCHQKNVWRVKERALRRIRRRLEK